MATQNNLNSNIINIPNTPSIPDIGYYNENMGPYEDQTKIPKNFNSYGQLSENLNSTCSINSNTQLKGKNGIYGDFNEPYKKAINGELNNADLLNKINSTNGIQHAANQIQYMACQLVNARNRMYDPSSFIVNSYGNIKKIFEKFGPGLRLPLILVFLMTMYFLISGLFSSFDVTSNIIYNIQKNADYNSVFYWVGLLIGLCIPIILITVTYSLRISQNLEQINQINITNNATGVKETTDTTAKQLDYTTLSLFILLIFGFVGILFTINKDSYNNLIYTFLIGIIILIISILIYVLYAFIPFFNTANEENMMRVSPLNLQLFIKPVENNNIDDVSDISSNQHLNSNLTKVYLITAIVIFILTVVYFVFSKKYKKGTNMLMQIIMSMSNGLLGSCAILFVPIFWVINFVLGVQFFYIYPIILIIIRYLRYGLMSLLYGISSDDMKNYYSEDLSNELNNFKNYSAPWGLIGIEEMKVLMGMFGYENMFSKFIIGNNNSTDLSDNKFVSSGLLGFFLEKNVKGIFMSILYAVLTGLISFMILFYFLKV